jgi:hypothetical protein
MRKSIGETGSFTNKENGMPAKTVIILDRQGVRWRYVLWADVPASRQPHYAQPAAVSAYAGATTAENTAIATGAVAERVGQMDVLVGAQLAAVQAELAILWTTYQAEIAAWNPWLRYGSFRAADGSWTAGGVA